MRASVSTPPAGLVEAIAARYRLDLDDWREAHVDAWAYELANGIWEFCKEGDDFNRGRGARFAAAYRAEGGVVPPEHDVHLEPLIRCRRLVELTGALTRETPPVDWDYHLHNLRALDNLG